MKILALSTSTPRGSAAVLDDGKALATIAYADLKGHAERIFTAIDAALAEAGLDRTEIEAVACDVGPGSFTGVRVGVASAKGIAIALGIPVVGIPSLEAMAAAAFGEGAAGDEDAVLAAIDAKKSEIFVAGYRRENGVIRAVLAPHHRPITADAIRWEGQRAVVVGEIAADLPAEGARIARGPALDLPDAAWVARLAAARIAAGEIEDAEILEPLYVREPDAKPLPNAAPRG